MESLQLFYSLNNEIQSFVISKASGLIGFQVEGHYQVIAMVSLFSLAMVCVLVLFLIRRWKSKGFLPEVKKLVGVGPSRPRFRKRDKVLFYGRKMLRKVKLISGQVKQGKKRKLVLKFAHRILRLRKETERPPQLKVLEPPEEYLQEETQDELRVPPDAFYLLQSIRVFGDFEKPIFLRLCKHTEILKVSCGSFLFKIGDPDENLFIVQNGKVNLFITNAEGGSISLKVIKAGDSVISLLSFTDILTGNKHPYKTVAAKAIEDSTVVKLPMAAFQEIFAEYPDYLIRVIQIIMVRLQRVTFTALHQYLGLSAELVKPGNQKKRSVNGSSSPVKTKWDFGKEENRAETSLMDNSLDSFVPLTARKSRSAGELKVQLLDQENQQSIETQQSSKKKPLSSYEAIDDPALKKSATEAFVRILGLEDDSLLEGKVEIRHVPSGTYLMKEESVIDVALVYLLSGLLMVSQKMTDMDEEVHMFTAHPGEIVGGLAVLTGEPSFFTICAKNASSVAILAKNTVYSTLRDNPTVVLHIANTVVQRLSPFVRQVDFALDWMFFESGRAIYRQGAESDCTYIVLSGRLRSVITHENGKKELVGEYGKGDLVGIVEMVTHTSRSTTVIAVRDSELAKLPEGLFNAIKLRFPIVVTRLINLLGHRIIGNWQTPRITRKGDGRPAHNNFSTVAIVSVSDEVPLTAFTYELYHSLTAIGPTQRLTSEICRKALGVSALEQSQEYRLTSWLAQQEDQHRICLYQCDSSFTTWTQRCLRQADCILIVGLGYKEPAIGKIEQEIERLAIRTMKELILLHKEGGDLPSNTIEWLNMRSWICTHHHVQCSKRMFSRRSQFRINELYAKVLMSDANIHSDFSRLARWLTGMSVGLVLGGGGAKGASHVGMIKAIEEAGIPIDMVGGVSIGAFIGALWCMERNVTVVTQKAREWSKKMNQWWSLLFDLTYPVTSMFTGKAFNRTLQGTFGNTYIEDLWIPYFTVSTDITDSAMRIHRHGIMWRYVRASMSLSGYMPPLCDPSDGHLLLDGGYVNNLPADVMRNHGARHIFAIDVGSQDDTDLTNYGDSLSGWWLLWKRFYPFTSPVKVPNLPEIQSRLAYVSCVRQLEEVKNSDYCEYIRPPIDKYKTLQFGSFDEIREVGYKHGKAYLEEMMKSGLPPFMKKASFSTRSDSVVGGYKFTDLAQMVCNVRKESFVDGESTSETDGDEDGHGVASGYASEPSVNVLQRNSGLRRRAGGSLSFSEPEIETESEVDDPPANNRR